MNVLVLTCSTGEGHNSAALSIYEELKNRKINVIIKDALSFGNLKTEKIVKSFFNNVAIKTPSLFGIMYKAGSIVSNNYIKSPIYLANLTYAKNLLKYISKNKIDKVICTHLFPMEALTYLKRKKLLNIDCYAVLTDYTAIPFIEETELDIYFIPHKDLINEFTKKGILKKKLIPLGIPVSSKFNNLFNKKQSKKILNLPSDKKIILIMTGGVGCGDVTNILSNLMNKIDDNTIIIVLTGKNNKLRKDIDTQFNNKRVKALPFTKKVQLYMDACDILLSKPGGLSSTEAAVKTIPLIHTMPILGCETKNANFFNKKGMSIRVDNIDDLVYYALKLLNSEKLKNKMVEKQGKIISKTANKDIVEYMINVKL